MIVAPPDVDPHRAGLAEIVEPGGYEFIQAVRDAPVRYPMMRRRKDVVVRNHPGEQFEASWEGSETRVCQLVWNEPDGTVFRTYQIRARSSTCSDDSLVSMANQMSEVPPP